MNNILCKPLKVKYYTHFTGEETEEQPTKVMYLGFHNWDQRRMCNSGFLTPRRSMFGAHWWGCTCPTVDPLWIVRTSPLAWIFLLSFYGLLSAMPQTDFIVVLLPLDLCPCVNGLYFPLAPQSWRIHEWVYFTKLTKTYCFLEDPERKQRNWSLPSCCSYCIRK